MASIVPQSIDHSALLIIDVQPDFMPGGSLACEHGNELVPLINTLLSSHTFRYVVATQDWHPHNHVSFVSQHSGHSPFDTIPLYGYEQVLWPPHCLQNSSGAALHPDIDWAEVDLIVRKGSDPQIDSYSAFRHNPGPNGTRPTTGLAGWLKEQNITDVYLCGLARDVCVLWSAEDAVAAGFNVHFLWSYTRPVTSESNTRTREALEKLGVDIIEN